MAKKKQKKNRNSTCSDVRNPERWDAKSRKAYAKHCFNGARKCRKEDWGAGKGERNYGGLDPAIVERRTEAILALVDEVREHSKELCPDIPGVFSVDKEWIAWNATPVNRYELEEESLYLSSAVAIWILDYARDNGVMDDLISILSEFVFCGEYSMPKIWDPCHAEGLIRQMVALIQLRNGQTIEEPPANLQNNKKNAYIGCFTTSAIAERAVDKNDPIRKTFDAVLDLIDSETLEKIKKDFENKYWDWTERFLRTVNVVMQKRVQHRECRLQLEQKISQFTKQATEMRESLQKPLIQRDMTVQSLSVDIRPGVIEPFAGSSNMYIQVRQLETELKRLDTQRDEIDNLYCDIIGKTYYFPTRSYSSIEEEYGREIADIWLGFDSGNPYAMCFALLLMLENDSHLPWCFYAGAGFITACVTKLPWTNIDDYSFSDFLWDREDYDKVELALALEDWFDPEDISEFMSEKKDEQPTEKQESTNQCKSAILEDWYQLKFESRKEKAEQKWLYNLSHILYEATGCIMPRNFERYLPASMILDQYGVDKNLRHPLMCCISLLSEMKHQDGQHEDFSSFFDGDNTEDFDDSQETESAEDLKKQLAELRTENKRLKREAYDANRALKDEKKRYESLEQRLDNDAQELADLRELAFHYQEGLREDEEGSENISFPYSTTRRIVVFGGHDSWSREIKHKLPDVRFIDREMVPNAELIRRADVVWIQTNSICHTFFYKIIDEVRKYDIPVRYFSFASATKCAEQLVLHELEHG